jgi:ketosteroid isomerase-like protein
MTIKLTRAAALAALLVPALAIPATAGSSAGNGHGDQCELSFDRAVDAYVETTDERDAAGFAALLHEDVTAVFANGGVLYGKDQTMGFIEPFFEAPGWTQSFDELTRQVEGCRSGFVLFDSVYTEDGTEVPLVIGLTFTRERGRWLVLQNQDSSGPASQG